MKRIISFIITVSLILQCICVSYAVESDVVFEFDFDTNDNFMKKQVVTNIANSGDSEHGMVLKVSPNQAQTDIKYSQYDMTAEYADMYIISFDFLAKQTDHLYRMIVRDQAGGTWVVAYGTFINLIWDEFGNIVISKNAKDFAATKSTYNSSDIEAVPYEADRWYSMTIVVDAKNSLVDYYLDGECIVKGASRDNPNKMIPKNIFLGTSAQKNAACVTPELLDEPDGTESLYIDNFKMIYADGDMEFDAVISDEIAFDANSLEIAFSEDVGSEYRDILSDITVKNCETGEAVSSEVLSISSKGVTVGINEELSKKTEYVCILPNGIKSITGKTLSSEYTYFYTGASSVGAAAEVIVAEADFEDGEINGDNVYYGEVNSFNHEVAEISGVDGNPTKAAKFTTKSLPWAERDTFGYFEFKDTEGELIDSVANGDKAVLEYDVLLPQSDKFGFFTSVNDSVSNAWGLPGRYCSLVYDKTGYLGVYNAPDVTPSAATLGLIPETSTVSKMTEYLKDEWHSVKIVLDRVSRKTNVYIDGSLVQTTTEWSSSASMNITGIIKSLGIWQTFKNASTYSWGSEPNLVMYVDNIKLGYPQNLDNKVKSIKLKNRDGEVFGALSEASTDAKYMDIYFYTDIDDSLISEENFEISDANNVVNAIITEYSADEKKLTLELESFLYPESEYKVMVTGVKSASGADIAPYSIKFKTGETGSFEILNAKLTDENGKEIKSETDILMGADIYLNAVLKNNTLDDKSLKTSVFTYANGALSNISEEEIELLALSETLYGVENNSLYAMAEFEENAGAGFVIFDSETGTPLASKIIKAQNTEMEDDLYVKISGEFSDEHLGVALKADVLYPGTDENSYSSEEIAYRTVAFLGEKGEYEIEFAMSDDSVSGNYVVVLTTQNGNKKTDTVKFVNKEQATLKIEEITEASKLSETEGVAAIEEILENNKADLGIEYDFTDKINLEDAAEILYYEINENGAVSGGVNDCIADVVKAVFMVGVCEGKTDAVLEYAKKLDFDDTELGGWYDRDFVKDEVKKEVTDRMNGKSFESFEEFYDELLESFILSVVHNPDGVGNAEEIIKEFKKKIGISGSISNSVYSKVYEKYYDSYDELKEAVFDAESDKSSGGGSGGSGGGGSKNKTNSVPGYPNANINMPTNKDNSIPKLIFDDIAHIEWASEAIMRLAERGILAGKTDRKFYPDDRITRAEFMKILVLTFAPDAKTAEVSFLDVKDGMWYSDYVKKGVGAGFANGYGNGMFGANDFVTRQDMCVMMYNAAKASGITFDESSDNSFVDGDTISDYAKDAVNILCGEQIVNGVGEMRFDPKSFSTRAQAAKVIYGLLELQ